jgi:hypothetical protein
MTSRDVDGASVLALHGRIVLGHERSALRDKLQYLISEGKKKIVLNMNHIEHIDGSGLGILVAAHVECQDPGRVAQTLPPGRKIPGSPATHKAGHVVPRVDTEAVAIASFSKPDEAAPQKPSDSTGNRPPDN